MRHLLVGGHCDGERHNIENGRRQIMMVNKPLVSVSPGQITYIPEGSFYSIRELRSASGGVELFAIDNLTDRAVMQRLLDGYNPVTAVERG